MAKVSDDSQLEQIYEGYKSSYSLPVPSQDRQRQWLNFLSQEKIATLPVSWQDVETSTGSKSWGANVTFAGIMNDAKVISQDSRDLDYLHTVTSSRLQDYVIGLHEDQKVIDSAQACELLTMFGDRGCLEYFLEQYHKIEQTKEVPEQKKKVLKPQPLVGPEVFLIEGGGAPKYDGSAGPEGYRELRDSFDKSLSMGLDRASSIVERSADHLRRTEGGKKVLQSLEKNQELSRVFDKSSYHTVWTSLEQTYNQETNNGTQAMSQSAQNFVRRTLNNLIEDVQINCVGLITRAMKSVSLATPTKQSYGPEMGM